MPGKAGWKSPESVLTKLRRIAPEKGPDECWPYNGARGKAGYGRFWDHHGERVIYAHRMAFELEYGPVPTGLMVLHRCDCPPCTNPEHLFLGTCMDNKHDSMSKGRHVRGVRQHSAKLLENDIPVIRGQLANGIPMTEVARRHGVTMNAIAKIRDRISWKHVAGDGESNN